MFDLIMDWIVVPLLDLLLSKQTSGQWRFYFLFPVAAALGVGLWWVGERFDPVLLVILGASLAAIAGIASIVTWIPREKASWQDLQSYRAKQDAEVAPEKPEKES